MVWMNFDPRDDDPRSSHGSIWGMAGKMILAVVISIAVIVALVALSH
jgi:hypothetical protein